MLKLHRYFLLTVAALVPLLVSLYAYVGQLKPFAHWKWIDICGEGGTALLAAVWLGIICYNRPRGLVTRCFAFGFAALMLGNTADCLDEFFAIPKSHLWDNILESGLNLGGMLSLTAGMYFWQEEQRSLNRHMEKRERVFRDHRGIDRVAQIANADYLRQQISWQSQHGAASLVMLNICGFHKINRHYGQAQGDHILQSLAQWIVFHIDAQDVLCRYAADHYVLLLPGLNAQAASEHAQTLCDLIQQTAFPLSQNAVAPASPSRERVHLQMRFVVSETMHSDTLTRLSRELQQAAA